MNNTKKNRLKDSIFKYYGIFSTFVGLIMLAVFIIIIFQTGIERLSLNFLTSLPSRFPEKAGIYSALMGTAWMLVLTVIFSVTLGVSAGIYLEEYARKGLLSRLLEINIANLVGIPSVIYGILGLAVFNRYLGLGGSLLTGSLTLSLLIIPIIIVTTRESLKAVPKTIREAAYALGATKWQTIWKQQLPAASGSIVTGIILAIARAIGEAAPLIVVGALVYVPFAPQSPLDDYTVLPIQIFNWTSRPQVEFQTNASAGIIVLLFITFLLNGISIYLRNRWQKKVKW
ncbi:MAG TPA: phosphate ABC transporter permease PstA [Lentimicrobium sp.]|nr:phosphate ABC transporter permease PstA [Lentimicrobium sp.]